MLFRVSYLAKRNFSFFYSNDKIKENLKQTNYPRDMIGYGQLPPDPKWPKNSRLAVQFVINYEEGGENCTLHGDATSEAYLSDLVGTAPLLDTRNLPVESLYEYGSRAGFWRLYRVFTERKIPVTVFGVAMALERNPAAVNAILNADWEIASHGYRWIDYAHFKEEVEQEHLLKAIEIQTRITGCRPFGWYTGRVSANTRKLIIEEGKFLYDSDNYADDLPYWVYENDKPHLVIPYTLDNNDIRFVTQGLPTNEHFFTYLKDSFDLLYAEGATTPKMMSIGLHCRLIGKAGRIGALTKFLDYLTKFDDIWICKRIDIAKHWHKNHKSLIKGPIAQ